LYHKVCKILKIHIIFITTTHVGKHEWNLNKKPDNDVHISNRVHSIPLWFSNNVPYFFYENGKFLCFPLTYTLTVSKNKKCQLTEKRCTMRANLYVLSVHTPENFQDRKRKFEWKLSDRCFWRHIIKWNRFYYCLFFLYEQPKQPFVDDSTSACEKRCKVVNQKTLWNNNKCLNFIYDLLQH
jgi:hypothetical protein